MDCIDTMSERLHDAGVLQTSRTGFREVQVGPDVLNQLSQQTGLSREELLTRLTRELPTAVDKLTPEGWLPTEDEAAKLI